VIFRVTRWPSETVYGGSKRNFPSYFSYFFSVNKVMHVGLPLRGLWRGGRRLQLRMSRPVNLAQDVVHMSPPPVASSYSIMHAPSEPAEGSAVLAPVGDRL